MDESSASILIASLSAAALAMTTGAAAALSNIRLGILEKMSEEGNNKAERLLKLLEPNRDKLQAGLWILKTLIVLPMGMAAYIWANARLPENPWGLFYTMGVVFFVSAVLSDILPIYVFTANPEAAALFLFPFIKMVSIFCFPFSIVIEWVFFPLVKALRRGKGAHIKLTEEEIKRIVEQGKEMGVLEEEEKDMINSIFTFGDTIAREIMVPRVDMICVENQMPVKEVMKIISETGFSRIPVYKGTIDEIQGVVYAKDILRNISEDNLQLPAIDFARTPPYFIPDTKNIDSLLREMRQRSISIAIVVDEYGGTDGLITIEDIIEEIVGDITDEHDRETPSVVKIDENKFLVDGSTIIEDVNSELNLKIPAEDQETIGGFVYGELGHIPAEGEKVELAELGAEIIVKEIKGQRITSLLIEKTTVNENNHKD